MEQINDATLPVTGEAAPPKPASDNVVQPQGPTLVTADAKPKRYLDVAEGEIFDGRKVDFIYAAADHYIVFESGDEILYRVDPEVPLVREATAKFHELLSRAEMELKGAYRTERHKLLGDALVRALDAEKAEEISSLFAVFDEFLKSKTPVKDVFGRTSDFIVFLDSDNYLRWEYMNPPKGVMGAIAEVEKSLQLATASLLETDRIAARRMLGNELAVAFRLGEGLNIAETFAASRAFISSRIQTRNTTWYVVTSLLAVATSAIVLLTIVANAAHIGWFPNVRLFAIGALGGVIGAWISVLQRSGSLQLPDFTPHWQVVLQAGVRMILGCIFGALIAIAIHAGIAFSNFHSLSALVLISVAAGFSERLVPDLLTNLATSGGKQQATQSAAPANAAKTNAADPANAGNATTDATKKT